MKYLLRHIVSLSQLLILSSCLFFSSSAWTQIMLSKEKAINKSFENKSYPKALELYENFDAYSLDLKRQKALSYWYTYNPIAADSIFKIILESKDRTSQDIYNYALILKELNRYEESDRWMKEFYKLDENDSRGKLYRNKPKAYKYLQKDNKDFTIKNLSINSEDQDFSPIFYGNKVVFSSSREGVQPIVRRWSRNTLPFLDIYVADRDSSNELSNPTPFSAKLNKKFHEGPVTFNSTGDFMIFTRNNYKGKNENGEVTLQLFSSKLVDGDWSEPVSLPFNSPTYSVGHASLSADGKTLYFASNMPGGIGGVDLYKSDVLADGAYGVPVNLGPTLNTEGDELFPFIHADGEMLFFASNGRVGLGGLDVYMAQVRKDKTVSKVVNLGAPVNSNADDFAFCLEDKQTMGYFSSNREGGKGDDDIYGYSLVKPFVLGKLIKGSVKDELGEPMVNTEITLFNLLTGETEILLSGEDGTFEFVVESDRTFNLRGYKSKYFVESRTVDSHTKSEIIYTDLILTKDSGLMLSAYITDKDNNRPLQNVKLTLINNESGEMTEFMTPVSGTFEKPIKDKKLNDSGDYTLVLSKDGFIQKTLRYQPVFDHRGKYEMHVDMDLSMERVKVGGDLSKLIDIKPILFDVGKFDIRPDAALELDKIVKVMNEYPSMIIELGSHTDSRGNAAKNASLSDRRAKASAKYISERISNSNRIIGKGYGESRPNTVLLTNDSGEEKKVLSEDYINSYEINNPELFEKLHQMNRRTEFIIIKM